MIAGMDSPFRKWLQRSIDFGSLVAAFRAISEIIGIAGIPDDIGRWRSWLSWVHSMLTDTPFGWLAVLAISVILPFVVRCLTRKPVVDIEHITGDSLASNHEHSLPPVSPKTDSKLIRVIGDLERYANQLDESVSRKDAGKARFAAKSAWQFAEEVVSTKKLHQLRISWMQTFLPVTNPIDDCALRDAPHAATKLRSLISQLDERDLK